MGARVDGGTTATLTGGVYSDNGSDGATLTTFSGGVTANGVTAERNRFEGLLVTYAGPINVTGGAFRDNGFFGIGLGFMTGAVQISNVTATGNLDGLLANGSASLTVTGGTFSNNREYGINLEDVIGDAYLGGVTTNDNGSAGLNVTHVGGSLTFDGVTATGNPAAVKAVEVEGKVRLSSLTATSLVAVTAFDEIIQQAGDRVKADRLQLETLSDVGKRITVDSELNEVSEIDLQARNADDTANAPTTIKFANNTDLLVKTMRTAGDIEVVAKGKINQAAGTGIEADTLRATVHKSSGGSAAFDSPSNKVAKFQAEGLDDAGLQKAPVDFSLSNSAPLQVQKVLTAGMFNTSVQGAITGLPGMGPLTAKSASLTATAIGTVSNPLPLDVPTLAADTSSANGNQFISATGTATATRMDAGLGKIQLSGGKYLLGSPTAISELSELGVGAAATVDLNNNDASVGGLSGQGQVLLGGKTLSTGKNGKSTAFDGTISGVGGVTKTGAGTQTLNGNNSYKGQTKIEGGGLTVNGSQPASAVKVDLGGTLRGKGKVGSVVVKAGGKVAPGLSPGVLTVQGDYTQEAGGTLEIEIGGLTPGIDYDQLVVTGTAYLGGTLHVTFINGFLPLGNESFNFLTYGSVVGDFAVKEGLDAGNGAVLSPTFGPHGVELMVESVGPINVTSQVSVASSDLTTNHADKQLYGTIDITNTHGGAIPGSLAFVWQGLTSGVKVQQVSVTIGTVTRVLKVTKNASGDPQVVIPESLLPLLASGQTIQLNVRYKTSSPGAIDFTPQLIEAPLA